MKLFLINSKNITIIFCIIVFVLLLNCLALSTDYDSRKNSDNMDYAEKSSEKILSRRRRYLVFPSGSSLQLVYDQIVGVVDYTNLFILGVTVAFAWQLPTGPPSEIVENLKTRINEGILNHRQDENVDKLIYKDEKNKTSEMNANSNKYKYLNPESFKNAHKPMYYNQAEWTNPLRNRYFYRGNSTFEIPFKNEGQWLHSNYQNKWAPQMNPRNWSSNRNYIPPSTLRRQWHGKYIPSRESYRTYPTRRHRIYPVFRKRSVDEEEPDFEDELNLRYHRSTRHDLYSKISKYLQTQGKNGTDCVLKALCETGQKRHEQEPGTFIGEIMRAIFTLPQGSKSRTGEYDYERRSYDDAHTYEKNCIERYPDCPESLWDAAFIF